MKRYKVKIHKTVVFETEVEVLADSETEAKSMDYSKNTSFKEIKSNTKIISIDETNKSIKETGNRLVKIIDGTKTIPTGSIQEVSSIYVHGGQIWKITFIGQKAHIALDKVRHLDGSKVIKKSFYFGLTKSPECTKDIGRLVIPVENNKRKGLEYKPYIFVGEKNGKIIVNDGNEEKSFRLNYDWVLYDDGSLTPEDYYTEQNFELYTDNKGIRMKKLNEIEINEQN